MTQGTRTKFIQLTIQNKVLCTFLSPPAPQNEYWKENYKPLPQAYWYIYSFKPNISKTHPIILPLKPVPSTVFFLGKYHHHTQLLKPKT